MVPCIRDWYMPISIVFSFSSVLWEKGPDKIMDLQSFYVALKEANTTLSQLRILRESVFSFSSPTALALVFSSQPSSTFYDPNVAIRYLDQIILPVLTKQKRCLHSMPRWTKHCINQCPEHCLSLFILPYVFYYALKFKTEITLTVSKRSWRLSRLS